METLLVVGLIVGGAKAVGDRLGQPIEKSESHGYRTDLSSEVLGDRRARIMEHRSSGRGVSQRRATGDRCVAN